jgi:alpha-beta hydrolase superfamily lysophospholipase
MVLFGWLLPRVPGLTKRGTSNLAYAEFIRKDPLFVRWPPTSWVRSLYYWEQSIRDYEINNREILILQGEKDRALEWEYNIDFFESRFPNCIVEYFPGANHTLFGLAGYSAALLRGSSFHNVNSAAPLTLYMYYFYILC